MTCKLQIPTFSIPPSRFLFPPNPKLQTENRTYFATFQQVNMGDAYQRAEMQEIARLYHKTDDYYRTYWPDYRNSMSRGMSWDEMCDHLGAWRQRQGNPYSQPYNGQSLRAYVTARPDLFGPPQTLEPRVHDPYANGRPFIGQRW